MAQNTENMLKILNLPLYTFKRFISEQVWSKPATFKISFLKLESGIQDQSRMLSSLNFGATCPVGKCSKSLMSCPDTCARAITPEFVLPITFWLLCPQVKKVRIKLLYSPASRLFHDIEYSPTPLKPSFVIQCDFTL